MRTSLKAAVIVTLSCASCAAPDGDGREGPPGAGVAREAWCQGYYVDNVVAQNSTVCWVSPGDLAGAADGWGPQILTLSVDQGFSPQVSYQESPSVSFDQSKVTKALQKSLSFSLTQSVNITADTGVAVPTGAYYRVEAYPEYQPFTFDVNVDPCGPTPDAFVTSGSAYRPVGIYFKVMDFVGGAWNALAPPSPIEVPPPGSPPATGMGGAGASGAGMSGAGAGMSGSGAGGSGGHH
jgi:hypothetical protein